MSKARTLFLIVLVLLLVIFAAGQLALRLGARPPAEVRDLHAFMKWHPLPQRFHVVTKDGREYLVVAGRPFGLLPSGPTAYVFDKSGRLLEWSADASADRSFRQRWPIEYGRPELRERTVTEWPEPATTR